MERLRPSFHKRTILANVVIVSMSILLGLCSSVYAQQRTRVFLPFVPSHTPLQLSAFKRYATTQYSGAFIGEVRNLGVTDSYSVTVQAVFQKYPGATTDIFTITKGVQVPVLSPNSVSPVVFYFDNPMPKLLSTTISSSEKRPSNDAMLTVTPQRVVCTTGYYGFVRGVVRNTTVHPVVNAYVYMWSLRDDFSRGYAGVSLPAVILPGEEVNFATSALAFCDYNRDYPDLCYTASNCYGGAAWNDERIRPWCATR